MVGTHISTGSRMTHRWILMAATLALLVVAIGPAVSANAPTAAWRHVRYSSVEFAVPAAWPVFDLTTPAGTCILFNRHAVYLGDESTSTGCPAHAVGRTEAIQVEPLSAADAATGTPMTIGGQAARLLDDGGVSHAIVVAFPAARVLVTLSYGFDQATALAVLASFRALPGAPVVAAPPAMAPATAPMVPSGGTFTGKGFDKCGLGKLADMRKWYDKSPYKASGIYMGGANAACPAGRRAHLWVAGMKRQGWMLIPIYVGLQAPCANQSGMASINPSKAARQGTAAADDAVKLASSFGISASNPIYYDMEGYDITNQGCDVTVETFLSAWTVELHAKSYVSGVYSGAASGIIELAKYLKNSKYTSPDDIWIAEWNGQATTHTSYIPDSDWANHQRLHQYSGDHNETYGGVTYTIDNDYCDGTLA